MEGKISVSVSSACEETFELESPIVGVIASNICVVARSVNEAEFARLAIASSFLSPSSRSVQSLDLSLTNAGANASRSLPPFPPSPPGGLPLRDPPEPRCGLDLIDARALNASIIFADPSSPPPPPPRAIGLRATGSASGSGAGETRPLSSACVSFRWLWRPNLCCERRWSSTRSDRLLGLVRSGVAFKLRPLGVNVPKPFLLVPPLLVGSGGGPFSTTDRTFFAFISFCRPLSSRSKSAESSIRCRWHMLRFANARRFTSPSSQSGIRVTNVFSSRSLFAAVPLKVLAVAFERTYSMCQVVFLPNHRVLVLGARQQRGKHADVGELPGEVLDDLLGGIAEPRVLPALLRQRRQEVVQLGLQRPAVYELPNLPHQLHRERARGGTQRLDRGDHREHKVVHHGNHQRRVVHHRASHVPQSLVLRLPVEILRFSLGCRRESRHRLAQRRVGGR
mmetsp:Transcript_7871/g.34734  ORF Transcript_7871/g.34734 Transcript_7871/m.34734 type:complete len:451 (+) Transcript_7871:1544-2896(+)